MSECEGNKFGDLAQFCGKHVPCESCCEHAHVFKNQREKIDWSQLIRSFTGSTLGCQKCGASLVFQSSICSVNDSEHVTGIFYATMPFQPFGSRRWQATKRRVKGWYSKIEQSKTAQTCRHHPLEVLSEFLNLLLPWTPLFADTAILWQACSQINHLVTSHGPSFVNLPLWRWPWRLNSVWKRHHFWGMLKVGHAACYVFSYGLVFTTRPSSDFVDGIRFKRDHFFPLFSPQETKVWTWKLNPSCNVSSRLAFPRELCHLWYARKAILRLMNWQSHKEILGALFQSSKGPSWAFWCYLPFGWQVMVQVFEVWGIWDVRKKMWKCFFFP